MENSAQQKRIDTYWAKVFEIRTETGDLKYSLLGKVVKSFLGMPNGNANVEPSLSDNKNTLTSEGTNMTKETLEGLKRAKEYARSCGGAHNNQHIAKRRTFFQGYLRPSSMYPKPFIVDHNNDHVY